MSAYDTIRQMLNEQKTQSFQGYAWGARHYEGMTLPVGFESLISLGIISAARYVDEYRRKYESDIGGDYVLGPCFLDILRGLHGLLTGEIRRLDGGACDSLLYALVKEAGFPEGTEL